MARDETNGTISMDCPKDAAVKTLHPTQGGNDHACSQHSPGGSTSSRLGRAGQPAVLSRRLLKPDFSGPTNRGPASRVSNLLASRFSGCATHSPRITPAASAIATEAAVIIANNPADELASVPCVISAKPR